MKTYTRLTLLEREEISRLLASGASLRTVACRLNRSAGTISRETRRALMCRQTYRATLGHRHATRWVRPLPRGRKLDRNPRLRTYVFNKLKRRWSPEQIAKQLRFTYPNDPTMHLSHESIYTYVYVLPRGSLRKELIHCLRQGHTHRRRRKNLLSDRRQGPITDFLSIEERPAEVARRTVPGHWEGDLIVGRRHASALGTLVERTTRWVFLVPLIEKSASGVRKAFAKKMKTLPDTLKRSLTYDQGSEMSEHRLFTKNTGIQVYFAHPASPWERGTNENTNGLIRQFFPKGTDFSKISPQEIQEAQDLLNERPRKVLAWRSPNEAMNQLLH